MRNTMFVSRFTLDHPPPAKHSLALVSVCAMSICTCGWVLESANDASLIAPCATVKFDNATWNVCARMTTNLSTQINWLRFNDFLPLLKGRCQNHRKQYIMKIFDGNFKTQFRKKPSAFLTIIITYFLSSASWLFFFCWTVMLFLSQAFSAQTICAKSTTATMACASDLMPYNRTELNPDRPKFYCWAREQQWMCKDRKK